MITSNSTCADADAHLVALIQELSRFGLGVFRPHKHSRTGSLIPLPAGEVALEHDLHVTFVAKAQVTSDAVPVGWRWNGTAVEVCAACCDKDGPPPPTERPAPGKPVRVF